MTTILLLTLSNVFMTFAWYGHLKYRNTPLFKVIMVSWLIAFAEYCFQVPANRIGSYEFSTAQLKTIQEVITLSVFSVFSVLYLKEPLKWNYLAGFAMIGAGRTAFIARNPMIFPRFPQVDSHHSRGYAFNRTVICPPHVAKYNP